MARSNDTRILAISTVLSVAFLYPSLIENSKNAGFLYTGDIVGFYLPTIFKVHQLVHSWNFSALDYSLFNGSSDFFISPNFYTFHPVFLLSYLVADPIHDTVIGAGRLIVFTMLLHVIASMYFTARLMRRLLSVGLSLSIFGAVTFTFTPLLVGGLVQPEFLFSVLVLPWVVEACFGFVERPTVQGLFMASIPSALALLGGYLPVGAATLLIGSTMLLGISTLQHVGQLGIRLSMRRNVVAMMPILTAGIFCLPFMLAIFLYNKETTSVAMSDIFYSAQQLSELPSSILRAISDRILISSPIFEFSIHIGIISVLILVIFFSQKESVRFDRKQLSVFIVCFSIYFIVVLAVFGNYSVVSDFFYYFVPQIGRMHIYQRLLWPANLTLALMITFMLSRIVMVPNDVAVRVALGLVVVLLLGSALVTVSGWAFPGITLNGYITVQLLCGAVFLLALLLPSRKFTVIVAAALLSLPAFDQVYDYSIGGNQYQQKLPQLSLHLNQKAQRRLVSFIKRHTTKDFVKYVDLTPMWAPAGNGIETFPKEFPYLVLDRIRLSSFGGFTFYLSSRAAYMKHMPVGGDVRISPDFEVLRRAGADFVVALKEDLEKGALASLVDGIPESDRYSLPNNAVMISLASKLQLPGTLYDDGLFRIADDEAGLSSRNNVARGSVARQSGTLADARLAVDGNRSGSMTDGSVSHSLQDPNAWLDVDLGEEFPLEAVRIWNRTDCCQQRLKDFWLFVSSTPFSPTDKPNDLLGREGVWSSRNFAPLPKLTVPTPGISGRYIRIQLSGDQADADAFLHIAELEVFRARERAAPPMELGADVVRTNSNFANHSSIEVNLTHPARLTYLFWPNPRLSFMLNGVNVTPKSLDGYNVIDLPSGRSVVEIRYTNSLMIGVWLVFMLYWGSVVACLAIVTIQGMMRRIVAT